MIRLREAKILLIFNFPYLHNMKHFLILAFVALMTCKASAQKRVELEDVSKYIGKVVTVHNTINSIRKVNQHLTYLYIGGDYPTQKLTVIDRSSASNIGIAFIVVTGRVVLIKGKPSIIVKKPGQIATEMW
jgi:hypothetical protein